MDEMRRKKLDGMDIRCITDNGIYWLKDRNENTLDMDTLSVSDIRYLRWKHKDNSIASGRVVPSIKNASETKMVKKPLVVSREQKYNNPKYRLKTFLHNYGKKIIIYGMVVCIGAGALSIMFAPSQPEPVPSGAYVTMTDPNEYTTGTNYMDSPTVPESEITDEEQLYKIERAEYIRILCQIFQVDYQTTYTKLVEMTDDFCDVEYLAGRHPLVSCKGMQIDADTEEEFLVYAVRVIAQDPNRVGLSVDQVCINDGYDSGTDYVAMIAKWAEILKVDPALVYGIMHAETGWTSDLFLEGNNPGGLKDGTGDGFWIFPNKEAGIIELMMEIIKYQYMGAITIEQMAQIHCPIKDPNDKDGLNNYWVDNVLYGYEKGRDIFEKMGFYQQNNGLSY